MHCIYIYANPEKSFIKNYQVPWKMKSTYAGRKTSTLTLELKLRIGISCRPAGPQWAGWQRRRTWCCLGWLATIQPPKPERDRDINHCIDSHVFHSTNVAGLGQGRRLIWWRVEILPYWFLSSRPCQDWSSRKLIQTICQIY